MRRLRFVIAGVAFLVSLVLITVSLISIREKQRGHLFCEEIRLGMSQKEVKDILEKYGYFSIIQYESFERDILLVNPSNLWTYLKYGSGNVELVFSKDDKNELAVVVAYRLGDAYSLCE
jgi:hypothetical protein